MDNQLGKRVALLAVAITVVTATFLLAADVVGRSFVDLFDVSGIDYSRGTQTSIFGKCVQPPEAKAELHLSNLFPSLNFSYDYDLPSLIPTLKTSLGVNLEDLLQDNRASYASRMPAFVRNFLPWGIWDEQLEARFRDQRDSLVKVVVVPFSHNDPAWTETFATVANRKSYAIIQNVVEKLSQHKSMTFVWSEVCLLAHWYHCLSTTSASKAKLLDLLRSGRLEILGGGWVMPDEASTTTYAIVDQLIEGHQWLAHHLNVMPTASWSIDPFGLSATLPYILRQTGITTTMIVRVHYAWKRFFAKNQMADFVWRQPWDAKNASDVFCHHHPFDIYTVRDSLGPNRRLNDYFHHFFQLSSLSSSNLHFTHLVKHFISEVRRAASLTKHRTVLLLLGDDFRYLNSNEFDQTFSEFQKLFSYVKDRPELNIRVEYGTLSSYAKAAGSRPSTEKFPVVSGDFFPYADTFVSGIPSYWSGFYTTRPWLKALGRRLEHHLRCAEILFTASGSRVKVSSRPKIVSSAYRRLTSARRSLALFQHHDAVTGTSKAFVTKDLAKRLRESIDNAVEVSTFAARLITSSKAFYGTAFREMNSLECDLVGDERRAIPLIVFNPLSHFRHHHVRCRVFHRKQTSFRIESDNNQSLKLQLVQDTDDRNFRTGSKRGAYCTLHFMVYLPPLTVASYIVHVDRGFGKFRQHEDENSLTDRLQEADHIVGRKLLQDPETIILENDFLSAEFDSDTGLLQAVNYRDFRCRKKIIMEMLGYLPGHQSGAYIMRPRSIVNLIEYFKNQKNTNAGVKVTVLKGSLFSEVQASFGDLFRYKTRIYHGSDCLLSRGIYLNVFVNLNAKTKKRLSVEPIVRVRSTSDFSETSFFTDSNGFQMLHRPRVPKLDVEGNYFPVTRMAYVENDESRLSVLVSEPHGVASLTDGWLEVMLDRKIYSDDGRGIKEGIVDNQPHTSRFLLLYEFRQTLIKRTHDETPVSHPSLLAHHLSDSLNNPVLVWKGNGHLRSEDRPRVSWFSHVFPCDVHLVNWRTLSASNDYSKPSQSSLLILHRRGVDCTWPTNETIRSGQCSYSASDETKFESNMKFLVRPIKKIVQVSLTGLPLKDKDSVESLGQLKIPRMEIRSWKLTF